MKKITQNFTNVKLWQSIIFAFMFLLSATTFSQVTTFPYCSSFDTDLGDWTTNIEQGSSDWVSASSNTTSGSNSVDAYSGGGSAYYYDYSYAGNGSTLISPVMDISAVTNPEVTFQLANPDWSGDQDTLAVWYRATETDAWAVLGSYDADTTTYDEITLALPNASATYQVAFNATSGYGYGIMLDDVCVDAAATEPGMSVSATTGIGSATFTFALENFTVAATDGGGDGHIHYSLNGGDTVMVYSSDDLTLTGLPNGDHSIVFSLVDNNHTALDPAVEATVAFTTFNACGETVTYTQVANGNYTVGAIAAAGEVASVTINATMETNYDHIYVYDGAGTLLNTDQDDGTFSDAVYSSSDGTISVNVTNDGSVQNGDVTLAFTCAVSTVPVTFTVNTQNITVGANGIYLGGGVFGDAAAVALTDADSDGTWEVTVDMVPGTTGNYIFLNSPNDGGDWGAKEDLAGQDCADAANYNDRILPAITEAMTIQHCYGSCESDGTCPNQNTSNVTFTVNMSSYGLAAGDVVYLNGSAGLGSWCGDCNPMTDNGDSTWSITKALEDGDYQYKFTVNGWTAQEFWDADGAVDCDTNIEDGGYENRLITVAGANQSVSFCWNACAGDTCDALELQGIIDFTVPEAGSNGKAIHVVANADIADLSIYGIGVANNGGGTDGLEYTFDAMSVTAGDHILVARSVDAMNAYMDASSIFNHVLVASTDISQNGDDAIELYKNGTVIETFGDIDVDGSGQDWEYTDSWAYKVAGAWTFGEVNCTDNTTTTCESSCPYPFAICENTALIDFLSASPWRYQYEVDNYRGVGPGDAWSAQWWNATAWSDAHNATDPNPSEVNHGNVDDSMTFDASGGFTFDTGDDGAIFGKKPEIDAAFDPDGTNAYAADNDYAEYWTYPLADFTDTYTVGPTNNETITFATVGGMGFYTALAGQEYQILERTETTMYVRNVGSEGNSWYSLFTTDAHIYASTDDSQILDVMIYPNPVDGNYVTIMSPVNGLKNVEIFDINGRRIMDTAINNNTLDVSSINSGFYMIKVTIDGQTKISKLVVR
jgi:hypothetical protein